MFERINGLPAHALLVHAAVVFVPLLVLVALAFGLVPRLRPRVWWAAVLLAVVAPASAFLAKESGEALEGILRAKGYPPQGLAAISTHSGYGTLTFWYSLALGVIVLAQVYLAGGFPRLAAPAAVPGVVGLGVTAVSTVIAVVTAYYAFKTGDTGAKAVWTGV